MRLIGYKEPMARMGIEEYRWIVIDPDLLGGQPCVRGTRLTVAHVLACLAEGMSGEEIATDYQAFRLSASRRCCGSLRSDSTPAAPMWLLDHNLPVQLCVELRRLGIESDSASARGWEGLRNGELVKAAHQAGFQVILTRDRLFARSAVSELRKFPEVAVVLVDLPQRAWRLYRDAFLAAWLSARIEPAPGATVVWPGRDSPEGAG